MWQYYKVAVANNDFFRVVQPDWRKLMEHCYYGTTSMKRIEYLIYKTPSQVYRIWDYSDIAPLVWNPYVTENIQEGINWRFYEWWTPVTVLEHEDDKDYYLINRTKMEYINMSKQERNKELSDSYWRTVHPLWLLCRANTEDAGWDYHSDVNREFIGHRFWDRISVSSFDNSKPLDEVWNDAWRFADMTEKYYFKE